MYKGFHESLAEITKTKNRGTVLIDEFLPLISGLKEKLDDGIKVLDVGCGAGLHDFIFGIKQN